MKQEAGRFAVELLKINSPNGSRRTVPAIPMGFQKVGYQPPSSIVNTVLPDIEKEYRYMLEKTKKNQDLLKIINSFLENTSKMAIVGSGLVKVLSEDLQISSKEAFDLLLKTEYVNALIRRIENDYRKVKKDDPISYAEGCQQLVDLFGFRNALALLRQHNIKMKKSTLQYLCHVSTMSPKIKNMIMNGDLPLTVAFMIPKLDDQKQIEIAEKVKKMSYAEAKKAITHFL